MKLKFLKWFRMFLNETWCRASLCTPWKITQLAPNAGKDVWNRQFSEGSDVLGSRIFLWRYWFSRMKKHVFSTRYAFFILIFKSYKIKTSDCVISSRQEARCIQEILGITISLIYHFFLVQQQVSDLSHIGLLSSGMTFQKVQQTWSHLMLLSTPLKDVPLTNF